MVRTWVVLAAAMAVGLATAVWACGGLHCQIALIAANGSGSDAALQQLKAAGPDGLAALAEYRQRLVDARKTATPERLAGVDERLRRIDEAMDAVGGAKYCSRSNLYWHTDFERAREAAKASGKPILSLRLLGNLTDEFSCANSRFFRTTLYANADISQFLRDNFVLHWKSVRPVPIVTIDFGDGRKLQRTLTGNSIHYVLTPDGEVVDALPGLYGPQAFQRHLETALAFNRELATTPRDQRSEALATYHTAALERLKAAWVDDLRRIGQVGEANVRQAARSANRAAPTAIEAAAIARPKAALEMRLISEVLPAVVAPDQLNDEKIWGEIAVLHASDAELDEASRALIRSENPTAMQAGKVAITKRMVEDPLVRMVRSFQGSIALDTVKNEYQLHRRIHEWLADPAYRPEVDVLNDRVYAELFLTPRSDPWLGLAPSDTYTALPGGGVAAESTIVVK